MLIPLAIVVVLVCRHSQTFETRVCVCVCVKWQTEILPFICEFLSRDLRYESLSHSAEQKRIHYVNLLQSFQQQSQVSPPAAGRPNYLFDQPHNQFNPISLRLHTYTVMSVL